MAVDYEKVSFWADHWRDRLAEFGCERAEVAGGIRRGKAEPHDIEVVAQVKTVWKMQQDGLLEAETVPVWDTADLDRWLTSMTTVIKAFDYDQIVKRNGPRYKRFVMSEASGIGGFVFELFLADETNFGNTLAIRTGDGDFSKGLMTPRRRGGLMPDHLVQMGGRLYQYESWDEAEESRQAKKPGLGIVIPCPEEIDIFNALGLPMPPPAERDAGCIERLKSHPERRRTTV